MYDRRETTDRAARALAGVGALCTLILSKLPPWRYEEDAATRCTLPGVACASSMAMVESKASGPGSCSRSGLLR